MKDFFIEVNGRRRRMRYTSSDGRELYRRHKKPLSDLVWCDVLGFAKNPDGTLRAKDQSEWNPVAQFDLLYLGLKNDWPQLTEDELDGYVTKALMAIDAPSEAHPQTWIGVAAKAAMYQGIVYGRSVDFEKFVEDKLKEVSEPAPQEQAEGNAAEPIGN